MATWHSGKQEQETFKGQLIQIDSTVKIDAKSKFCEYGSNKPSLTSYFAILDLDLLI